MKSCQNVPAAAEMVERYHVGFRIQPPVAANVSGQNLHMTCRLELFGRHAGVTGGDKPCSECIHVLESLFEISDRLRLIERETFEKVGGTCQTRAHYASTAGHEVRLGFEMTFQHPARAMAGGWSWIFLQRVRAMLTELGCRNCTPPEKVAGQHNLEASSQEREGCKAASAA